MSPPLDPRKWTLLRLVAILATTLTLAAAEARPETQLHFSEVSDEWGLAFRHHHCGTGELYMIETMGSGVVVFDYDGDGDPDVLFVDSGHLPGYDGEAPQTRLFRNESDGTRNTTGPPRFVDVTERSGITVKAYGMGATAGDVDSDGDLDLYVTSFGPNQLFLNDGDGTFTDAGDTAAGDTAASGKVAGDPLWGTSAAFADPDGDGDLDLYVANYVDFTFDNNPFCGPANLRSYCHPDIYAGVPDRFYLNDGGRDGFRGLTEATQKTMGDTSSGKGLGVVWGDLDGDGRADLYVANDMTLNFQFQNQGGAGRLTFEDVALFSGTAVGDRGQEEASMGIAIADADGDGRPDLFVTHLDRQTNAFYSNRDGDVFSDRRFQAGLAEPSMFKVGFGAVFADLDSDGDQDLAVANGHIIHNIEKAGKGSTYRQQNQVFENLGGTFREVTASGLDVVRASRGLAAGDLDLDGDLDLVVNNSNDLAEVYRNDSVIPSNDSVTPHNRGWLQLTLVAPSGNRQAIGARVEVRLAEKRQVQEVRTGSSYLSQSELVLHFGLGAEGGVSEVIVQWPGSTASGEGSITVRRQVLRGVPANRRLRLARPAAPDLPASGSP